MSKVVKTKPEHEVAYLDLLALLNRHGDKVTAMELLAIAANMIGKLMALQDQRKTTPEMAMQCVIENLQTGNAQVISMLANNTKGNA